MPQPRSAFNKDQEDIIQKFSRLLERVPGSVQEIEQTSDGVIAYFQVKVSALNLLARTAGENSIYFRELVAMGGDARLVNPSILRGVLTAAMTDFREGFMADTKLLVSAEVFADFLVQAEVLLEHDYKDAAAVIIRSVLEDALRRVCNSNSIEVRDRAGIAELAKALGKKNFLSAVQAKEIEAKKEVGNKAAHGRFEEYSKEDVIAFHEFVQRLLATLI